MRQPTVRSVWPSVSVVSEHDFEPSGGNHEHQPAKLFHYSEPKGPEPLQKLCKDDVTVGAVGTCQWYTQEEQASPKN